MLVNLSGIVKPFTCITAAFCAFLLFFAYRLYWGKRQNHEQIAFVYGYVCIFLSELIVYPGSIQTPTKNIKDDVCPIKPDPGGEKNWARFNLHYPNSGGRYRRFLRVRVSLLSETIWKF